MSMLRQYYFKVVRHTYTSAPLWVDFADYLSEFNVPFYYLRGYRETTLLALVCQWYDPGIQILRGFINLYEDDPIIKEIKKDIDFGVWWIRVDSYGYDRFVRSIEDFTTDVSYNIRKVYGEDSHFYPLEQQGFCSSILTKQIITRCGYSWFTR